MKLPSWCCAGVGAVVCLSAGCSGDPMPPAPSGGGGPGSSFTPCAIGAISGTPVAGTFIDTHCTDTGTVQAPRAGAVLTALVKSPEGSVCELSATVDAQGAFSFPAVPRGPFVVRGASLRPLVTSERMLDLGTNRLGRPDVASIQSSSTFLHVQASDSAPVTESSRFSFLSFGAATRGTVEGVPPDVTSVDVRVDESQWAEPHLVDASKGDRSFLLQMDPGPDTGVGLVGLSVSRVFEPDPFTQEDGKETTLAGAFRQPPGRTVSLEWDTAAFEAERGPDDPPAGIHSGALSLVAASSEGSDCTLTGFISNTFFLPAASITLPMANPYPTSWPVMVMATPGYNLLVVVPLDTLAGPLRPVVSAARDLSVNGQSARVALSGVGTTPTLSFTAPAVGEPDAYVIDVVQGHVPGIEGGVDLVAQIVTSDTSITLPMGVLAEGGEYAFHVSARKGGAATAPYKWWRAAGYAQAGASSSSVRP